MQTEINREFYGEVTRTRKLNHFTIINNYFSSVKQTPPHFHSDSYLCFINNGNFETSSENMKLCCSTGDFIVHPAGYKHFNNFLSDNSDCINISFSEKYLNKLPERKSLLSRFRRLRNPAMNGIIGKIIHELKFNDNFSELIIEGYILELLGYLGRENHTDSTRFPGWIKHIFEYLNDNYANQFTLDDIASQVNMHPAYIVNAFKTHTGCTMGGYVRKIRIQNACNNLSTGISLSQLALECGFSDQSHFNRSFKKETGLTPLVYRKKILKN